MDTIGFDPIEEGALPSSPAIKRGLNKSVDNASKLDSYSSEILSSCFGETPTPFSKGYDSLSHFEIVLGDKN